MWRIILFFVFVFFYGCGGGGSSGNLDASMGLFYPENPNDTNDWKINSVIVEGDGVKALSFSKDTKLLVLSNIKKPMKLYRLDIYDISNPLEIKKLSFKTFKNALAYDFAFFKNEVWIAQDGLVRVLNLENDYNFTIPIDGEVKRISFLENEEIAYVDFFANNSHNIAFIDTRDKKIVSSFKVSQSLDNLGKSLVFGDFLFVEEGQEPARVYIFDIKDLKNIRLLKTFGNYEKISDMRFDKNRDLLFLQIASFKGNFIDVYDMKNALNPVKKKSFKIFANFYPNSMLVLKNLRLYANYANLIKIIDIKDFENPSLIDVIKFPRSINSFYFSKDGDTIFTISSFGYEYNRKSMIMLVDNRLF